MSAGQHEARLIDWTGERCVPWGDEVQGIYEHLHRYYFARELARGRRVVDLGSGEGYGAALLAEVAEHVVGVDVDPSSINHSRQAYGGIPNLEFLEGSALDLGELADGSFSAAFCLEVIEHIAEQERLVDEARRLLASDGVFVASTPDRDAYGAKLDEPNPFHVRELSRAEFVGLLGEQFRHVALWGQLSIAGSRLHRLDEAEPDEPKEFFVAREGQGWSEVSPSPTFFVALASNKPLPSLPSGSYLLDPTLEGLRVREQTIWELLTARAAGDGHSVPSAAQGDVPAQTDVALAQRVANLEVLEATARARAQEASRRLEQAEAHLAMIQSTRSWRFISRYRSMRGRLGRPKSSSAT